MSFFVFRLSAAALKRVRISGGWCRLRSLLIGRPPDVQQPVSRSFVNVKQIFTSYGKQIFALYGKEFFTLSGKENFT